MRTALWARGRNGQDVVQFVKTSTNIDLGMSWFIPRLMGRSVQIKWRNVLVLATELDYMVSLFLFQDHYHEEAKE